MNLEYMWGLRKAFGLSLLLVVISSNQSFGQDTLKSRKSLVVYGTSASYAAALVGLNQLWYQDYDQSSFHLFDDNNQWLQMDKIGHGYSTYILSKTNTELFEWAGFSRKQSALYASGGAFLFLTTVEFMDAYSEEWGFSWGDFAANTSGTGIFLFQELVFQKQLVKLKFSYTPSKYRKENPSILGENELQGVLKDYNAQTYWASINLNAISPSIKPEWLSLAFGVGASGMIRANRSDWGGALNTHDRQWYFGPDIDFEKIPTKKKWVKTAFFLLNTIRLPLPALEFGPNQAAKMNWIQF